MIPSLPSIDEFNATSKHVKVVPTNEILSKFSELQSSLPRVEGTWADHIPPSIQSKRERVNYLSMLVAIDYRHWGSESPLVVGEPLIKKDFYSIIPVVGKVRGSQAMVEMLKMAGENGIPWYTQDWILEPDHKDILLRALTGIDSNGNEMLIPDFDGRWNILEEISAAFRESKGDWYSLFVSCGGLIMKQHGCIEKMMLLHNRYKDLSTFGGKLVPMLKLAQLTVIAVSSVAPELFASEELQSLNICPDYQVPKALVIMGTLVYSSELATALEHRVLLAPNGEEEVAIRLGSVVAARFIMDQLKLTTSTLDYVLWKVGRECSTLQHHLCVTVMY